MEFKILSAAEFDATILYVHANYNIDKIVKTIIPHLPYFMDAIPNVTRMTLEEVIIHIHKLTWFALDVTNPSQLCIDMLTYNVKFAIICETCPFNTCAHVFPDIRDMRKVQKAFALEQPLYTKYQFQDVYNPSLAMRFECIMYDTVTIDDMQKYLVETNLLQIPKNINDGWQFGAKLSHEQVRRSSHVMCMVCNKYQQPCPHLFSEISDPKMCTAAFLGTA